jgi:hypothetical protein
MNAIQTVLGPEFDQTTLEYIFEIMSTGTQDEIFDAVPPLLESISSDERLKNEILLELFQCVGRTVEEPAQKTGALLSAPVRIAEQIASTQPNTTSRKYNLGNTYEVVNIDQKPVDDEESDCVSLHAFLELTHHPDPVTRKKVLRELCPCHVKRDVKEFWDRIFEMIKDPDPAVRYQVLHNLCDGSPKAREDNVIKAIEEMQSDEDKYIKRRVNQVLTSYRKTGKWNIL